MNDHLVIIGGVAAGTKAAAKARREAPDLKISVYTDEKYVSYSACGLPYYLEGLFADYKKLIVRSKEFFKEKENIDIFTEHRVSEILPESKEIVVKNLISEDKFNVSYSKLLIATGAKPILLNIAGVELENIFTLRNIDDGLKIQKAMKTSKKAVIVGAGYIGIETLEALAKQEIDTTIIEMAQQIMPILDEDMAYLLEKYIVDEVKPKLGANIEIVTNDAVKQFTGDETQKVKQVETVSGRIIEADMVILAIGVKPNVEIAKQAGIEIGTTGAIKVTNRMQTNFADIYAAGDCAEQTHMITHQPVWIPLGSTANKQGRIAAINITDGTAIFKGVAGSAVTKFFDFTIARTGLSEKEAKKYGINYELAIVPHKDRSGYMPLAEIITIKLLAEIETEKILGVQIIGKGDADKRVNEIATAINAGMTIEEFLNTDLTYAPPYSSAIDPILTAAQVIQNKLRKKSSSISAKDFENHIDGEKPVILLNADELKDFVETQCEATDGKNKKIVVYCQSGRESYISAEKLKKQGFSDVKFIDGGLCICKKDFS